MTKYTIAYASRSFRGNSRKRNEDNLWCCDSCLPLVHGNVREGPAGRVKSGASASFAVFDGFGSGEKGVTASFLAAHTFGKLSEGAGWSEADDALALDQCRKISAAIRNHAEENHILCMGATMVCLQTGRTGIRGYHLGDCRCYRFTDGRLQRLTGDHCVTDGQGQKRLQRYLGAAEGRGCLQPSVFHQPYLEDDLWLLCSNGVTETLPEWRLAEILADERTLTQQLQLIREEVLRYGGEDDHTMLLLQVGREQSGVRRLYHKVCCRSKCETSIF